MLQSAAEQYDLQSRLGTVAKASARRAWRLGRLDLLPVTMAILMARAALEAEANLEAVLAEQGLNAPPSAAVVPAAFGRQAADGRTLSGLFERAGSSATLELMAITQVADVWRMASGASIASRPAVGGYVRNVGASCCSRCAVLSGRFYRWSAGFLRHPGCRCINIPTTRDLASSIAESPQDLFDQGRITDLSKANTQAILDGADINQVANAYRRTSGMQFAQSPAIKRAPSFRGGSNKFTTEGTTARGRAGQQQTALRRNGVAQDRLMPESIYRNAASREDALRQLRLNGWITDDVAQAEGRAIFAERRRVERNTRKRAQRAAASA